MCYGYAAAIIAGVGMGTGAIGAYRKQTAENKAAEYNARIAENNADIAEQNAQYSEYRAGTIIDAGKKAEEAQMIKTRQLAGTQRAGFAASNVVVGSGSAADAVGDTNALGTQDALTIRWNAAQDAYAARMDAYNQRAQAKQYRSASNMYHSSKASPWLSAGTSLIGSLTSIGGTMGMFGGSSGSK